MPTGHTENHLRPLPPYSPEPLGTVRCGHLAAMVAEVVPEWLVELHYDEHGKPAIVIMPEDPDDIVGPTLIVYASGLTFQLDELHCDTYHSLGVHLGWADILRAVQIRLMWEMAFPATLH
jgi:hypothetical protein